VKDLEWKKSFITKAIKYQQVVVPIYVEASNSSFFYNVGVIRKKLGIKANIEMFYLVDEVFKQKGKTITLTIGAPINYSAFTKKNSALGWAQEMKKHVYNLKYNHQKIF
jgi:putative hemolysin